MEDERILLSAAERLFVLICLAAYLLFAVAFPTVAYGPDEWMRLKVPLYIAEHQTIPYGWEPELLDELWGFSYGFQMKLPYLLTGGVLWVMLRFSSSVLALLLAARAVNALFLALAVYVAIRLTKRFTDAPCRWVFIGCIALTPQMVFLGSYFNLEAYSLLTVLLILDGWAWGLQSGWSKRSCVYLGIGMGLCVLGYEYAYGYVLSSAVLYAGWFLLRRREERFSRFWWNGCRLALAFGLVCGWYLVRNAILYDGDIFAYRIQNVYGERYGVDWLKPSLRNTPQHQGMSVMGMLLQTNWVSYTLWSTFGVLGYLNIFMPKRLYILFYAFLIMGAAGCTGYFFGSHRKRLPAQAILAGVSLALAAAITVGLSVYASWARDYQAQGRYILYGLVPVFLVSAAGWHRMAELLSKVLPLPSRGVSRGVAAALIVFLVLSTAVGFLLCVRQFGLFAPALDSRYLA